MKARFISPVVQIPSGSQQCFSFYYSMYGDNVDYLNVYVKKNGALGSAVWTRNGNQGSQWIQGQVTITGPGPLNVSYIHIINHYSINFSLVIPDMEMNNWYFLYKYSWDTFIASKFVRWSLKELKALVTGVILVSMMLTSQQELAVVCHYFYTIKRNINKNGSKIFIPKF